MTSLPPPKRPVIEWDRVSYAYGEAVAVEDVSLSIYAGELAAVLGPNGSGKSTLIRLALGLLRPTSGAVRLFGRDAADFADWDRVGYMPQVVAGVWRDAKCSITFIARPSPTTPFSIPAAQEMPIHGFAAPLPDAGALLAAVGMPAHAIREVLGSRTYTGADG